MRIIVFANRFERGSWKPWEHVCDTDEIAAVLDSANARAFDRALSTVLTDTDYLEAARYIFDRACGSADRPAEEDLSVTKVMVSVVAEIEVENAGSYLKRSA